MIHYTPLSYEEVFEEEEDESTRWITVDQATLKVVKNNELSAYEIIQMVSTDPNDYMKNHLQPGSKIYF